MADNSKSKTLNIAAVAVAAAAAGALVSTVARRAFSSGGGSSVRGAARKGGSRKLPAFSRFEIDRSMHKETRQKLFDRFAALKNVKPRSAIILQGGDEPIRYDTDAGMIHFRQESFFMYLFGVNVPGFYGVLDLDKKKAYLFAPRLDGDYELWCGKAPSLSSYQKEYGVDAVYHADEIGNILRSEGISHLYRLKGVNSDSGRETQTTADFDGIDKFSLDDDVLHSELSECRVVKTKRELDILRYVTKVSSDAHIEVMKQVMPGMYEYQMESIFLHECYFRGGARFHAYVCICGTGASGASLHYGNNDKLIKNGDIILNDMGSEIFGYASDITCSYPANGKFTDDQKMIYNGVLKAHDAVCAAMKPGVEWKDMHLLSHRVLTEHLLEAGLFQNGTVDKLMENHVSTYFYQHGLGHLIGLDVHDVGGYPKGVTRTDEPGLRYLRCGRRLEENMCLTVEPGCYFIDAFIDDILQDSKRSKYVNRDMVERFRGFGGVRIESDVIVTKNGIENMTKVPRTVEEIEGVMASGQ